jgi:guanylate kinase
MKGNLIIITSPSGGGKGTLIKEVLRTVPHIGYSVSYTTRKGRLDEEHGHNYFFVSTTEFERLKTAGEFLEWATVHDNFYATSRKQVENITNAGRDVILEIDVQGANSVLEKMPDAVSIFIMPPSFEVLRARLTARATETNADLSLRLKNSFGEIHEYKHFEYVVINEELDRAVNDLSSIILAERQRRDRQTEAIRNILGSFDPSKTHILGE